MKKRFVLIGIASTLSLLLSACSLIPDGTLNEIDKGVDTGGEINQVTEGNKDDSGKTIEKYEGTLINNIKINASVSQPDEIKYSEIKVTYPLFEKEEADRIASCFEKNSELADYECTDMPIGSGAINRIYDYIYSDNTSLSIARDNISYYEKGNTAKNIIGALFSNDGKVTNIKSDNMLPLKELDGLTLDTAINTVKKITDKLGITIRDNPKYFVADTQNMSKVIDTYPNVFTLRDKETGEGEKWTWTKEEEVYVFEFSCEMNGVGLFSKNYHEQSQGASAIRVQATVGRNGLVCMDIDRPAYNIVEQKEVSENLCTFDEALECLKRAYQYNDTLEFDIGTIELQYALIHKTGDDMYESTYKPYWVFSGTRHEKKNVNKGDNVETIDGYEEYSILVDAVAKTVHKGN